jgi:hypothetical protein
MANVEITGIVSRSLKQRHRIQFRIRIDAVHGSYEENPVHFIPSLISS